VVLRRGKNLNPQAQAFLEACDDFSMPASPWRTDLEHKPD